MNFLLLAVGTKTIESKTLDGEATVLIKANIAFHSVSVCNVEYWINFSKKYSAAMEVPLNCASRESAMRVIDGILQLKCSYWIQLCLAA